GIGVRSITLWLFGGVAQLEGEAHTAGADFRIAAVGPATSLALAIAFAGAQLAATGAGAHGLVIGVLTWLWRINLILAAFNLVPAAPLDGGRILRAALWRAWRDRQRAAVAAARAGRGFGALLIAGGLIGLVTRSPIGLWPALLGWFLYTAAGSEERVARLRGGVSQLTVGQVMTPHPPVVAAGSTVAELVGGPLAHYQGDAAAVVDDHGWLAGLVTADAVRSVPAEKRTVRRAGEIALPLAALAVARPDESMDALLDRMATATGGAALVLDALGRLAGVVTTADLVRAAARGAAWSATGAR
ncbi:MAG TPA: site-2 protease family protein, partial [Acidimicrobiales bacterium]|nr:site-2 protease family protein [Acidimicrobiales bacterium]